MKKFTFTKKQQELMRENRLKLTSFEIGEQLGCSGSVVQKWWRENGLQLTKAEINKKKSAKLKAAKRTSFDPLQDEIIKSEYLNLPEKALARKVGKSSAGVRVRMRQLGLVVPKKIIEIRKKESQFHKGQVSHNKGLKQSEFMSAEAIERTKKNRFKKGQAPYNSKKNGAISVRKDNKTGIAYKFIRVSASNWKQYHYHVWEKENGKVPEGHCLWFKDGNSLNCNIENLECITRAENLSRNWHNYPKPLQTAIKLTKKINKQL
ncbi:MAG TPA: HNH endonuclease signature motif containing protein [Salinimicrobium sp.]|nr:HNH endonuclease signature motif containing protein [Salinimicrobium sp.]